MTEEPVPDVLDPFRQFFSFRRDVLVLSVALFAFSLGFQMTSRYIPQYLSVLGASGFAVGLFGTVQNIISALYPYPGGALSDRIGSRYALTLFGLVSSLGFLFWLLAPTLGTPSVLGVTIEPWVWIFVGLFLAQAWKSFGLGATFAVVKQSVPPSLLARGFASTEVFRRTAFLIGPLIAAGVLWAIADFQVGFQVILAIAVVFGVLATTTQHLLCQLPRGQVVRDAERLVICSRACPLAGSLDAVQRSSRKSEISVRPRGLSVDSRSNCVGQ